MLLSAGLINTTKAVMSSPLPKVYEDSGNGTAQPIATTQGLSGAIGGDFKVDELQRVSKETVCCQVSSCNFLQPCSRLHLSLSGFFNNFVLHVICISWCTL